MKKILIGALVGAIIYFAFQATMWMGGFNKDFFTYAPQQEAIMANLNQHLTADGLYVMPMPDPALNLTHEQEEAFHKDFASKPWAMVFYHTAMGGMDPMYIVNGFLYALMAAFVTSMVLYYGGFSTFSARFLVSMAFAMFTLAQGVFDEMNWWSMPWSYIRPQVIDMTLGWGLASLWLAKYVRK